MPHVRGRSLKASCQCWQGTSQTMEDVLELGRAVALHGPTPDALRAYEAVRCVAALRVPSCCLAWSQAV